MKTILIIEDDRAINNLIKGTLSAEGYVCDCAFDGREGANLLEEKRYDLVLVNIVADVIKGLVPLVGAMLAPGGLFLCSGIIDDRAEEVAEKLRAAGLEILETHSAEGWFSYLCR